VVVAQAPDASDSLPVVLGVGVAETRGMRNGYISNHGDAAKSIRKAVRLAEKASGQRIKKAILGIGGIGLTGIAAEAGVSVSRADAEVTPLDVKNLIEQCQRKIPQHVSMNNHVLHTIPVSYSLDGQRVHGDPIGMRGVKLDGRILFVSCLDTHYNDFIRAVEECDVEVVGTVASPIAASIVSLTKTQKMAGCVLANIGSETVSIVVYEEGLPVSLEVFPIGSNDITKDIALGLRVSLDEAETIKVGERGPASAPASSPVPKRKLDEIVMARLSDIFELIQAHLRKIGRNGLLPAGIIITGGGSGVITIEELARHYLNLPSKVVKDRTARDKVEMKDSMWSVAYGLCTYALCDNGLDDNTRDPGHEPLWAPLARWFKQFLP
jgi:cell division protein FtsA